MIKFNPKIIRDISSNLNVNYFDMCGEDLSGGKGSPYQCLMNNDGSILIGILNTNKDLVTMLFNGSNYVNINCSDGRYKVFTMSRRNEGNFELETILRTSFDVNI